MALTTTQVTNLCDSIAQAINDYNTAFITNTASNSPTSASIISGVTGTGVSATLGRVLNFLDNTSENIMLGPANTTATLVTANLAGIRSLSSFYPPFYGLLNAFDLAVGGLNAYLTSNSLQVNASFANAFNTYVQLAISLGLRSSANAPAAITAGNYFPSAAIDDMWDFTSSGSTTFSVNAVGTNASTAVSGGGVAQAYIYKVNSGNAAGSASFTISYTTGSGSTTTATYNTTSGTPTASGTLAGGFSISGLIGSAITGVSGSGMTSGEQYRIGMKLIRASAY